MSDNQIHGNYYNKYQSKNPIERALMSGFFKKAAALISKTDSPRTVLEAGCGEGHFTAFLSKEFLNCRICAFDIGSDCIAAAKEQYSKLNIDFSVNSIYTSQLENSSFDLVCCSEVMEHLEDPIKAISELERISARYVLITIPNEPLWRIMNMARLKYLKDFGNTPGHINHWNRSGFTKFITKNSSLKLVKATGSIPWNLFLFKKQED